MKYRDLGKTGIKVSEIGYGAWGIGGGMWQDSKDDDSLRALHRTIDLGLNFIDTALVYGDGHSENLVGTVIREQKGRLSVSSKIPPKNMRWPAQKGSALRDAFPFDHIVTCTEKSLKNLGLDTIDVQQFHVWDDGWAADHEWQDAVAQLKDEGKIRFFGLSLNNHEPENALRAAATGLVDTIQVIYNIYDQSPEKNLYPYCLKNKIGIIVRVPLDEGGLAGNITAKTIFPKGDFRNGYFRGDRKQQVAGHTDALKKLLGSEAGTLAELALRFCLHHPAVSTVIPGMRSIANVEANCKLSDGRTLSESLIAELRHHVWVRDFYED
ncbi:MAG: aldo/keto reductase [Ignavibacteriae bacterium]|nr:MAG: aldo/keto reductase [Ignavibacteriota bacterium]